MTAVPFALPAAGRNTVNEGLWMFLYHQSLCCSGSSRRASKPGAPLSHREMTCCACAAVPRANDAATKSARLESCMGAHDATFSRSESRGLVLVRAGLIAPLHWSGLAPIRRPQQFVDVFRDVGGTSFRCVDGYEAHLLTDLLEREILVHVNGSVVTLHYVLEAERPYVLARRGPG